MSIPIKHIGFHADRLHPQADNPRELAFAKAWADLNSTPHRTPVLAHLVGTFSQQDASVAATVIQWLGSNVGMSFLADVARDNPAVRSWLVQEAAPAAPTVKRKKSRGFTLVELLIILALVGIVVASILSFSSRLAPFSGPKTQAGAKTLVTTVYGDERGVYRMYTVKHDGHWFVTLDSSTGGILHHPGCPCLDRPRKDDDAPQ